MTTIDVDAPAASRRRLTLPRILETAVFQLLLCIVALAPLPFGSNRPGSWSLLALVIGALLLAWSLVHALERNHLRRLAPSWYLWPVGVALPLLGWFLLQASPGLPQAWHHPAWTWAAQQLDLPLDGRISIDPDTTLTATMRLASYAGVFFLTMQLACDRRRARLMLLSVAAAATAYAAYGLAMTFGGFEMILWYERWAYPGSVTGSFVNRNSFATYAGLGLVVSVASLAAAVQRTRQGGDKGGGLHDRLMIEHIIAGAWLPALAVMVLTAALVASQSRAGLAATALALAVLAALQLRRNDSRGRRFWLPAVALLLAVVAVSEGTVFQRIETGGIDALGNRLLLYRDVVAGIADRPWLGHGYGTFEAAFEGYRSPPLLDAGAIDKAHNSYLEFAFEAGLPALMAMLTLLGLVVLRCLRGAMSRRRDRIYPQVALAAAVLVGLHAMVDFSVQIPAVGVLFAFLLGLGFAQSFPGQARSGRPAQPVSGRRDQFR